MSTTLEQRRFGRSGHMSSRVIFGAAALARATQDEADRVLETLLEFGVNHIDVAASYGDAELRVAPWLRRHPGRFFVATKTTERSGSGARASLERSLERLGLNQVDLIQLHNLVEPEEWESAHARNGALDALVRARDEGLARYIGVTGHGLRIASMHHKSLERFAYDSVLLPYNHVLWTVPDYRNDVDSLLAVCAERDVAVQTIKSVARRRWRRPPAEGQPLRRSWYEPLTDEGAIGRAVRYVLANQRLFLISSSDSRLLKTILAAASGGENPAPEALAADARVFAMAPLFDGEALERI